MSLVHATVIERNYGERGGEKDASRRQRLEKFDFAHGRSRLWQCLHFLSGMLL